MRTKSPTRDNYCLIDILYGYLKIFPHTHLSRMLKFTTEKMYYKLDGRLSASYWLMWATCVYLLDMN